MANTLNNLGGTIGALVFAPMIRYLLDTYGLQGTLWIHSGILFHTAITGAILRSPSSYTKLRKLINKERDVDERLLPKQSNTTLTQEIKLEKLKWANGTNGTQDDMSHRPVDFRKNFLENRTMSYHGHVPKQVESQQYNMRERSVSESQNNTNVEIDDPIILPPLSKTFCSSIIISNIGSVASIPLQRHFMQDHDDNKKLSLLERVRSITFKTLITNMFDLTLLKNKLFLLNLSTSLVAVQGLALVWNYFPAHAKEIGISDSDVSILLSITAGADCINRILTAFISDNKSLNRPIFVGVCLIITGTLTAFMPLYKTFWALAVYSAVMGLFYGTFFSLFAVLLVDFIGIENLSKGLALTMVTHGISISGFNPIFGKWSFGIFFYYYSMFEIIAIKFKIASIQPILSMYDDT